MVGDDRRDERRAWFVFGGLVTAVLVWAGVALVREPLPSRDGAIDANGLRFGLSVAQRQTVYRDVLASEPADRASVAKGDEAAIWNRNRDDFFHALESNRVRAIAQRHRLSIWHVYLILDEGFRAHWAPPPGVVIYRDEAPMARTTRPLETRARLVP